ncbi:short-chain dehydrogenase [Lysinibacillus sp. 54212]|uniref:short-chain dehydrogenase n=1 Tax=Lysinibacillus sp. 54212 TaxID=3119829 RepID=UPI002FC97EF0
MDIWLWPAIFAIVVLCIYAVYTTMAVAKQTRTRESEMDTPVPEAVKEHPLILNPIIISYVVFLLFLGIVIFYYWAKSGY